MRTLDDAASAAADWLADLLSAPDDPAWMIEAAGYDPTNEAAVETRLSVSNGFLGVRGSLELPEDASHPRTYVAGLFDNSPVPPIMPVLLSAPDWLRLRLSVGGAPALPEAGQIEDRIRTLDLRRGIFTHRWRWRDAGDMAVEMRLARFVSLAERGLVVQLAQIRPEHPAQLALDAGVEPISTGLATEKAGAGQMVWRAEHSEAWLALACALALDAGGRRVRVRPGRHGMWWRWEWRGAPDQPATFIRTVAMARSKDSAAVARAARAALRRGGESLTAAHTRAWADRWADSDVEIVGDAAAQQAIRFAVYQLNGAANPEDERVSIGARALTGDGYRGHVFWDTEIFLLPFYTLTWPAAARALLMYRDHTLPAARAKAARLGYRGAFYAWESADTGEEATPRGMLDSEGRELVFNVATDETHISADVAYAVWQYWHITADESFLREAGAEIILETARFWNSRAERGPDGRYHIRNVIGPDEYHEGVDDNAYTNGLARWNIDRGLEVTRFVAARWPADWAALAARLGIGDEELESWQAVADGLVTGFDRETLLFEQFAGYFDLEPIDLAEYAERTVPMDLVLGRERTQSSQVIKQADVVMLHALLWDSYAPALREANFRYYEARCGHGSSLSPAIYALVAARLGEVELAERLFHQAAGIDMSNAMGNTSGGVHIATHGGLWQAAVLGFGGLSMTARGLRLDPHLPRSWQALRFCAQWRGQCVRFEISQAPLSVTVTLERGLSLRVEVGGAARELRAGETWACAWDEAGRRWRASAVKS